ncbi:GGDEF domain-containing protein [Desulfoferula mesophila]|uniref:diguanylate cyclase n=1 Tax=Desulfoferula mesophila TaxID=3058419 RepID=A0AAU9EH23_9BACT|nr:hypothetical protein FAK_35070 [Desulfoferula mesophilus]
MRTEDHKETARFAIRNKKDVVRATVLVAMVSVLGSWVVTVPMLLLAGKYSLGDLGVGMLISTMAPLLVAPPVAYKVFSLMLDLVDSRREIQRLSRTDDLTQTYNRRYFMDMARREFSLAARHGHPVSLLLIDLDGFKQINDSLGHLAGDKALYACADIIRRTTRRDDMVGRFGGDEFMVLAPYSDLESAASLADRIRRALVATDLVLGGKVLSFGASIGVVSNQGHEGDADDLLRRADQALYRAKASGGGRVELAA